MLLSYFEGDMKFGSLLLLALQDIENLCVPCDSTFTDVLWLCVTYFMVELSTAEAVCMPRRFIEINDFDGWVNTFGNVVYKESYIYAFLCLKWLNVSFVHWRR